MLHIDQASTDARLIVTLREKQTLDSPFFIFVFTGVTSKEEVTFVKVTGDDLSAYPERFNEFSINASVLFANVEPGQWRYWVYESEDGATKGGLLELGKAVLSASGVTLKTYEPEGSTFKIYGG